MRIRLCLSLSLLATMLISPARAGDSMHDIMAAEHGDGVFHMLRLETDYGAGSSGSIGTWDLDGWIGGDDNKLWLKSEGTFSGKRLGDAEMWALYSRNIATFWDAQIGVRYDFQPASTAYLALGFQGIAPYFFETEAHLFVSENGEVSLRLREENDFLLTQRLILQPYAEINIAASDASESETGSGLTRAEIGLQTRYEINRKIAPYLDLRYERKFGETASLAIRSGDDRDDAIASFGLRLMF